jgi:Spy/CpxP family protein refolding chaperone
MSAQRHPQAFCIRLRCAIFALAMVMATLLASGCSSTSWMGDGFHDEFAHWGEKQRPAGEPGNLVGLSEQAQEVERNLGVR